MHHQLWLTVTDHTRINVFKIPNVLGKNGRGYIENTRVKSDYEARNGEKRQKNGHAQIKEAAG